MNRLSDKTFCRSLGHECEMALRAIAEKHGLTVAYHGGSIGVGAFTAKLEFSESDRAQREFSEYCALWDLLPSDFGAVVQVQGQPHRLVGIAAGSYKMPFIMERLSDGSKFKVARTIVPKIVAVRVAAVPS